jgi:hypothetical protein
LRGASGSAQAPLEVHVPAGQTKTYSVLASIYTSLDHPSPLVLAARDLRAAASMSVDARWQAHVSAVSEALGWACPSLHAFWLGLFLPV